MLIHRPAAARGHANHGWLDTHHTFSFGSYHDPAHMGFRSLRVINDDVIQGGQGFGTHPHRDMEIITYVLDGALEHRDSLGNGAVLRYGDVQCMSAGSGLSHSEFNHHPDRPVHLLQIWILPARLGLAPGYRDQHFDPEERRGRWQLIAAPDGAGSSLRIHQNATLCATRLDAGQRLEYVLADGRHAWLQVASGAVELGNLDLQAGDGVAVSNEPGIELAAVTEAEVLCFDLG